MHLTLPVNDYLSPFETHINAVLYKYFLYILWYE